MTPASRSPTPRPVIMVGEGTAEPGVGLPLALDLLGEREVEVLFGVRRSPEHLEVLLRPLVTVSATLPGRGLAKIGAPVRYRGLSSGGLQRALELGAIPLGALVVVATSPDAEGRRHLGTVNGHLQAAVDRAPTIIVEEDRELPRVHGAAVIPADKQVLVVPHRRPDSYAALSRAADPVDHVCAEHVASLIGDGATLQLGVGGVIEAIGVALGRRRDLRIMTGAISSSIWELEQSGRLSAEADIVGSAIVGVDAVADWAAKHPRVRLMPSSKIHNSSWLAKRAGFWSINVALSVDWQGNANSEMIGSRRISGRGGAPDFARGAHHSEGGGSIVVVRGDRGAPLTRDVQRPTILGRYVDFVVSERGVARLRGRTPLERRRALEALFG